jgi:hypothetical protein
MWQKTLNSLENSQQWNVKKTGTWRTAIAPIPAAGRAFVVIACPTTAGQVNSLPAIFPMIWNQVTTGLWRTSSAFTGNGACAGIRH